jgi:ABC-type lipoprotein export system ATPase subunit
MNRAPVSMRRQPERSWQSFLAVCRQDEKTLLLVSHDEAALGGADRVIDMAELNRTEARRGSA